MSFRACWPIRLGYSSWLVELKAEQGAFAAQVVGDSCRRVSVVAIPGSTGLRGEFEDGRLYPG